MKTFLHYLNWALHDFNRLFWRGLMLPNLKIALFSLLFLITAFAPALIPGVTIEFLFFWTAITTAVLTFVLITYWIYEEERGPRKYQSNVITDTAISMHSPFPTPNKRFTLRESMIKGRWWTLYMFGVLFIALMGTMIFGAQIADLKLYLVTSSSKD